MCIRDSGTIDLEDGILRVAVVLGDIDVAEVGRLGIFAALPRLVGRVVVLRLVVGIGGVALRHVDALVAFQDRLLFAVVVLSLIHI